MAATECSLEIPATPGLEENILTVGREFLLVCRGEFPKDLEIDKLAFSLEGSEKYKIKLLNFELRSPSQADLKVTSYKTGPIEFANLVLTDGHQSLELGKVQFNVKSVLPPPDQSNPETKQEPFGPMGPVTLPVPFLYWAIFAGCVGLFLILIITKLSLILQRRKLIKRLKEHDSALTPISEFHQSLRRMQRQNSVFFGGRASAEDIRKCLASSQQMFKLYLTRRFQIPALEWSDRLILNDLKKYHPLIYSEFSIDLKKILKEFQRGAEDIDKLAETDVLNITKTLRTLVEKIEADL